MDAGATLADRFRYALDACDQAYVRGDATPVAAELRPKVRFPEAPSFAAAAPAPTVSGFQPPPTAPPQQAVGPPDNRGSTLQTIAIVAGVILLAIAAWFVRKRLIVPLLYGKQQSPSEDDFDPRGPVDPSYSTSRRSILKPQLRWGPEQPPVAAAARRVMPPPAQQPPAVRLRRAAPPPQAQRPTMQRDGADRAEAARLAATQRVAARQQHRQPQEEVEEGEVFFDETGGDPNFTPI